MANAPEEARVRFYCQGIGDCHLLTFTKDDGSPFRMLIDCGIHTSISGGTATIKKIAADVKTESGGNLNVIVGTHEHWDHISGFYQASDEFQGMKPDEVWLGWTEDPNDEQAAALDKFKGQALMALQGSERALGAAPDLSPHLASVRDGLGPLLGFQFGAQGERVRAARDELVALAKKKVRYLEPSRKPIQLKGLPNLRIYVLGPPRDEALIGVRTRKSEMYGFGAGWPSALALSDALFIDDGSDHSAPFDANIGFDLEASLMPLGKNPSEEEKQLSELLKGYLGAPKRRIDADWLGRSAQLAIQLDDRTNNSSLVLAFEFIDTGRVLLFAADAQVGNWLSWQHLEWDVDGKIVKGPELLSRTVFYKVGHHGSENATLKDKGLELMVDPDLSAFIPTNEADAKKVKWGSMPFEDILMALRRLAGKRVIRADDPWVGTTKTEPGFDTPSGSIRNIDHQQNLWVEMTLA